MNEPTPHVVITKVIAKAWKTSENIDPLRKPIGFGNPGSHQRSSVSLHLSWKDFKDDETDQGIGKLLTSLIMNALQYRNADT